MGDELGDADLFIKSWHDKESISAHGVVYVPGWHIDGRRQQHRLKGVKQARVGEHPAGLSGTEDFSQSDGRS
jgi:hypothetical protein